MAVRVLFPNELKATVQLPAPPESVTGELQPEFCPVMATVPVGVVELMTTKLTVTVCPTNDGLGEVEVMVVMVSPGAITG